MKGYLNNITLRTMNLGNLVEPRLPALFESSGFDRGLPPREAAAPVYEDVSIVNAPHSGRPEEPASIEAPASRPTTAKLTPEPEDVFAGNEHEPEMVAHVEARANKSKTVEAVPVPATPQRTPENLNFEEHSLEGADPARRPEPTSESQTYAATSHRTSEKRPPVQPTVSIPRPVPATDQSLAQVTFEQSTPSSTRVNPSETQSTQFAPIEQNIESEALVTSTKASEPEHEIGATDELSYRRVTPTPATWSDTRQQQSTWRRQQPFAPIESEPSINVTIGRIEVRAVPSDNRKATSPRRSESPVMPLEDYLRKQQRGGER